MASAMIHLAVANEINKTLKRNNDLVLIGSIAPDISKYIGESRAKSHFLDGNGDIPNINSFLLKYKNNLKDDFVLGFLIHLYTDFFWYKYFIPEIKMDGIIKKMDGTIIKCTENMIRMYIYNDYTNLNTLLLDEYNMDLHIFYRELPKIENIIDEIPMKKIKTIIDEMAIIIENSKINKSMVFDLDNVKKFIGFSTKIILSEIEKLI